MSVRDIQRFRCREKTSRGNAYDTLDDAERAALEMAKKRLAKLHGYVCPVCHKFHVGGLR